MQICYTATVIPVNITAMYRLQIKNMIQINTSVYNPVINKTAQINFAYYKILAARPGFTRVKFIYIKTFVILL